MTTTATPAAREAAPTAPSRKPLRVRLRRIPGWIGLGLVLLTVVYPMFWILMGSFKTQPEFLSEPFWALPQQWNLDNYVSAFVEGGLGTYIRNSVIAVFPALALILVLGTAAAFALQVLVWKGRGIVLVLFLAGIMVPTQMILLPLFTVYFNLHLTNSMWPMIITYTAIGMPLTVFMLATFMRAIPREVFEAATLDGASIWRIFLNVTVPLVRNAIFTVALVQFFFLWNDLLIAMTFITKQDLRTIQVGLLNFTGQYGAVDYGPLFAGISVTVFGTLAIYIFLNQKVMAGLTSGAVKG
ncbi:carbohydrate ABC transporter permease [Demequina sp. SYSU T00192]|uniref:Carbohydrate ABC transporter permease n=1 Tax=Demequina litoralis TaxID=3051660 RepID=A0ABT8G6G1_9MICO|nr:carbohydrate ABC transporter permease [Demequina sp. SYSU T00192]MDN4474730.1 carbohydrate ABC transporter permease [Demequina sp. SYSU T00192]